MSKILIAYNIKKIRESTKKKIAKKLFPLASNVFLNAVEYKKFGSIQLLYSNYNNRKFKFKISGNILVNVCGYIFNEKEKCDIYNVENIEDLLIKISTKKTKEIGDIISEFSGNFVIFLYNKETDRLVIVNDKFGFYPAFINKRRRSFVYSTAVEAMVVLEEVQKKINHDAISDYVLIGSIQNEMTLLSAINRLSGSSILEIKNKKIAIKKYYNLVFGDSLNLNESVDVVNKKLIEAVLKIYGMAKKDILLELTGGFDTRVISSIAAENKLNYSLISLSKTLGEKIYLKEIEQDLSIARKLVNKFHINIKHYDNGFSKREIIRIGGYVGEVLGGDVMSYDGYWGTPFKPTFTKDYLKKFSLNTNERYHDNVKKIISVNNETKEHAYRIILSLTSFLKHYDSFMPIMFRRPESFFTMENAAFTPFIDEDLLKAAFSVDYKHLRNKSFYLKLIEKFYLKYFKDIPVFHGGNESFYKYDKKSQKITFYKKSEENLFTLNSKDKPMPKKDAINHEFKKFNTYMDCGVFKKCDESLFGRISVLNEWFDSNVN